MILYDACCRHPRSGTEPIMMMDDAAADDDDCVNAHYIWISKCTRNKR